MGDFDIQNDGLIEHLMKTGGLRTLEIINAFRNIPRHLFVPNRHLSRAYEDKPLLLEKGQTISQPYTVAVMLEAIKPKKGDNILEIGTGSGWTACLLADIVGDSGKITTIDIFPELVDFAKKNLEKVKLKDIEMVTGDGKDGFADNSPYDSVLINAACNKVPESVENQVKINGRVVAPVNSYYAQRMVSATKISEKSWVKKDLGSFMFVPLL